MSKKSKRAKMGKESKAGQSIADRHAQAQKILERLEDACGERNGVAREAAIAAFRESGVPDLFTDADLVLKELKGIRQYVLNGCVDGIPKLRPFTISLVKRMLSSAAFFKYDAWLLKNSISDEELLKEGDFRDEDGYIAKFCADKNEEWSVVECKAEHVAQRKVLRATSDYIRASAAYAKEIGAKSSAELWLRAFDILLRYNQKSTSRPFSEEQVERMFAYIDEAASELYVAWMYPQLPSLDALRKEMEA